MSESVYRGVGRANLNLPAGMAAACDGETSVVGHYDCHCGLYVECTVPDHVDEYGTDTYGVMATDISEFRRYAGL